MAASRYDVLSYQPGSDGKDYPTKIGTLWPMRDGKDGFSLTLSALPLPALNRDGKLECRLVCFPPLPKDGDRAAPARNGGGGRGGYGNTAPFDDDDASVPF